MPGPFFCVSRKLPHVALVAFVAPWRDIQIRNTSMGTVPNMKFGSISASIALLLLSQAAVAQNAKPIDKKEVVKSTHTIKGRVIGFEVGDYVHAIIKDAKGKERSFFIRATGLDYYLALNAKKNGTFTYQVVDCYIEEAGARMTIERISIAKIGKVSSTSWWKSASKKASMEAIAAKYQPMVDKLTKNGS